MTGTIRIVEVGPRDGLQSEPVTLSPAARIAFVEKLIAAGLKTIEVGSFVSPKWVPQMAGTDIVLQELGLRDDVEFQGFRCKYSAGQEGASHRAQFR